MTDDYVEVALLDEYQRLASRTSNPSLDYRQRLDCAALGVAGETGEAVDEIKKVLYHGHTLNVDKLVKELGDALWYISEICTVLDISLSAVATKNIKKLLDRYPEGFSEEASRSRES